MIEKPAILSPERQNEIVEKAMDADSAVYIAVNRGHWEKIAPLLLQRQRAEDLRWFVDWLIEHKETYWQRPNGEIVFMTRAKWTEEDWQVLQAQVKEEE